MVYLYKPVPKTILHKGGWEKIEDRYIQGREEERKGKDSLAFPFSFKPYSSIPNIYIQSIQKRTEFVRLFFCKNPVFYLLGENTLVTDTHC